MKLDTFLKQCSLNGLTIIVLLLVVFIPLKSQADRVILNDGTSLLCDVVSEVVEENTTFLKISIDNSVVLIDKSAIQRVEETEDNELPTEEARQKLKDLLREGRAVIQANTAENGTDSNSTDDVALTAKHIKGWAYLYQDQASIAQGSRQALQNKQEVPVGQTLIVSPNSRATLAIGDFGEMGITPQSQIRFDRLNVTPTQTYEIDVYLQDGSFWVKIGDVESENWKRVKLIINSAQVILQQGILYCEALERTGAVDITYVDGNRDTKFWRSTEVPTTVSVGETLSVSPGSIRLTVQNTKEIEPIRQIIKQWQDWQPEALAVEIEPYIPPLYTFSKYPSVPALHPYQITIDPSMSYSAVTDSLGMILKKYGEGIEKYKFDTGSYPTQARGLAALRESYNVPGWRGGYISPAIPAKDYWGNPFVYQLYEIDGKTVFDVRSMGPNGQDDKGLEDDIR